MKFGRNRGSKMITRGRKRKAREMRPSEGAHFPGQPKGSKSTHLMVDDIKGNTTKRYNVWPSIKPDSKGVYKSQSPKQAKERGEVFEFRSKKKAQKFAAGSWKKRKKY